MNLKEALVPQGKEVDAVLPDKIVDVLRESAKERSRKKTPKRVIKKRRGKAGRTWDYIKKGHVRKTLDDQFPGWSFTIQGLELFQTALSVSVWGALHVNDHGVPRTISDAGGAEIKLYRDGPNAGKPLSLANDVKAAVTDCQRRCAARLGFFSDIYEAEEAEEPTKEQLERIQRLAEDDAFTDIDRHKIRKQLDALSDDSADKYIARMEAHIHKFREENS